MRKILYSYNTAQKNFNFTETYNNTNFYLFLTKWKKKKILTWAWLGVIPAFIVIAKDIQPCGLKKKKSCHMIFYEFYQYTYTCKLKDPRAGRPCASVRRKLEVSVCSKFIEKNQIIINSMKYILNDSNFILFHCDFTYNLL